MTKEELDAGVDSSKSKKNHLISRKKFREFIKGPPGFSERRRHFRRWCKTVEQAGWLKSSDIKATFGNADHVDPYWSFSVSGEANIESSPLSSSKEEGGLGLHLKHIFTHPEMRR